WGRRTLGQVLEATVADGDLSGDEAEWAASRILFENAADLYGRRALNDEGRARCRGHPSSRC
ncbi:MAG: hypothetical protein ACREKS_10420, partial [Candidatus Rokuibacteriota bacterium]